ncbi:MAG: cell division protein ZapA [Bacteroidales bacterium]
MEQQSIKIGIADRVYPIKINPAEEEKIRIAVKRLNERIEFYRQRFAGRDTQDALSMSLLQFALKVVETEQNEELSGLLTDLKLLDNQLSEYIENI